MHARGTFDVLLRRSGGSWFPLVFAVAFLVGCTPRAKPAEIRTRTEALTAVLEATLARTASGETSAGQYFGSAIAIDGDTAIVGARRDAVGPNDGQGSAYVFARSGGTWPQQAKLVASDGAEQDQFGAAVVIRGDTALVGSPFAEVNNWADSGAAYAFVRTGGTWSEQGKLVAHDLSGIDNFGTSLALDTDVALIGAPRADAKRNNGEEGGAYVFVRAGSVWTEEAKLGFGRCEWRQVRQRRCARRGHGHRRCTVQGPGRKRRSRGSVRVRSKRGCVGGASRTRRRAMVRRATRSARPSRCRRAGIGRSWGRRPRTWALTPTKGRPICSCATKVAPGYGWTVRSSWPVTDPLATLLVKR